MIARRGDPRKSPGRTFLATQFVNCLKCTEQRKKEHAKKKKEIKEKRSIEVENIGSNGEVC